MRNILSFITLIVLALNGFTQNYIEYIDRNKRLDDGDYQYDICISPDKKYMAMATPMAIKVVDVRNFKIIKIIPVEFDQIGLISFHKTNEEILIVGGKESGFSAELYNWVSNKLIKQTNPVGKGTFASSVAQSANYLVCAGDNKQLFVLDYNTLDLIKTINLTSRSKNIYNIIISKDESLIALCDFNSRLNLKSSLYLYDFNGTLKYSHSFEGFIQGYSTTFTKTNELYVVETKNMTSLKPPNTLYKINPVTESITVLNETIIEKYNCNGVHSLMYFTDNLLAYGGVDGSVESITLMYLDEKQSMKIAYSNLNDSRTLKGPYERGYTKYRSIEVAKDIYIIPVGYQNFNFVVDVKNKKSLGLLYHKNNNIAFVSNDGRFTGDNEAIANLQYLIPRKPDIGLSTQVNQFYTPKLFDQIVAPAENSADAITGIPDLNTVLKLTPELTIISPDSISEQKANSVNIQYNVKDNGDGIKEIRFYVNGKLLNNDNRGFKAAGNRSQEIPLIAGENIIEGVAVSNGGYQSAPDRIAVMLKGAEITASLYILGIGIDQYRNPKYNLNYALADVTAITDYIKTNGSGIFKNINVKLLTNQEATKSNCTDELNRIAQQAGENDVFMLYYAGHGVMSDGSAEVPKDYFMVLTDVYQMYGNDELLDEKGLSAGELREFCKAIKARKQVILLDACQSGGATETFAMRGASEEKAIIQLAQSAGVFLISSTNTEQFATELGELKHGVFTYALIEGLKGAADGGKKDGKITIKELEAYLNDRIPELTQKYRGSMQFPNTWSRGMDFPIVITK